MMKIVAAIMCIFATTILADEPIQKPVRPEDIAAVIRKDLPAGWRCTADYGCILITHDEQVIRLNPVSLPDHNVEKYGQKTFYMIALIFRRRMSDAQVEQLQAARRKAVEAVEPTDDGKHSRAADESRKYLIPEYFNAGYSIYVHRTDDLFLEIYPESVSKEITAIWSSLRKMIEPYPAR